MEKTLNVHDFREELADFKKRSQYKWDDFTYEEEEIIYNFMKDEYEEINGEFLFFPGDIFQMWSKYETIADFISTYSHHDYDNCNICNQTDEAIDAIDFIGLHLEQDNRAVIVLPCYFANTITSYLVCDYSDWLRPWSQRI